MHAARQVLEVDLMADADAGRHDLEGVERLHSPFHELVALDVTFELELHVQIERVRSARIIDHHRVIDNQIDRHQRLDRLRILAHVCGDVAHCGQIAEQRNAGEVLQEHAGDDERNLVGAGRRGCPAGKLLHVRFGDLLPVAIAQHRFEDDADRYRQARDLLSDSGLLQCGQRIEHPGLAGRELEFLVRLIKIVCHWVLGISRAC